MVSLFLSSCQNSNSTNQDTVGEIPETVTTSVITSKSSSIEAVSEFSNTNANTQTENQGVVTINKSESEAVTDTECGEYTYSPPAAALDVKFVRDNIIYKLDYTYYRNDGTADLPEYIFSDIDSFADEFILNSGYDYKFEWIGVDMFDINSDGLDDYIIVGQLMEMSFVSKEEGDAPYMSIERIYVPNGNDGFNVIDFPASCGKGSTLYDYVLSTKTNGFNDFMGSSHNGIVLISFDGNSTYSETEILDKDFTWEYLDNGLAKITVYAPDNGHKNEIAVVKFIYDTDYVEHVLLYSSLPDGTPSSSVIGKNGYDVFEFYVRRTDKAPKKWNDFWVGSIEIKYIS